MSIHPENISVFLKERDQWLVWRYETRDGKRTKVPYNARTGQLGKSNDPATWSGFETAVNALLNGKECDGIGFAFHKDDGLCGIDLDHCREKPNRELAEEILERFKGTYCELSPSGQGVRIFCLGEPQRCGKGTEQKWIEVYDYTSPRYLTVTGNHLKGTALEVTEQQEALDWLYEKYFKPKEEPRKPAVNGASPSQDEQAIIDKTRGARNGGKFSTLFYGGWQAAGYPSQSEADAALCSMLAFWTQDESQIDRIFRQSALMREKWDKRHHADGRTYGQATIEGALNTVTETYQSSKAKGDGEEMPNWVAEEIPIEAYAREGGNRDSENNRSESGGATQSEDPQDWPDPDPLIADLRPVAPFNFNMLPESIKPWIADVAERMQCPPDYPATAVMVALSAVIGRRVGIRPKQKDDWLVVPNLWGALIGRPSETKTPALREALLPLKRLEVEAKRVYEEENLKAFNAEMTLYELKKENAEKLAKDAIKKGDEAKARALLCDIGQEPKKPTRRRFIVNDATVEKLGELLNENPEGLLLERDELTGWLRILAREDRANDRAFYLEAWAGTGRYTYDRIGRGTIDIEAATVSIIGTIQPGKLSPYVYGAIRQGIDDDGLIQRFQLAVYPDPRAGWENVDRWPHKQAKNQAFELFNWLADLRIEQREDGEIPCLLFDAEAQALFNEWRTELEHRIRAEDIHPALESHLAKYRSLIPSIALIIYLADTRSFENVSKIALLKALAWGEYLESHAERIYALATDPSTSNARLILKRIDQLPDPFTSRDIHRKHWSGLHTTGEVIKALSVLEDHGYIKRTHHKKDVGRSSTVYFRHPSLRRRPPNEMD